MAFFPRRSKEDFSRAPSHDNVKIKRTNYAHKESTSTRIYCYSIDFTLCLNYISNSLAYITIAKNKTVEKEKESAFPAHFLYFDILLFLNFMIFMIIAIFNFFFINECVTNEPHGTSAERLIFIKILSGILCRGERSTDMQRVQIIDSSPCSTQ